MKPKDTEDLNNSENFVNESCKAININMDSLPVLATIQNISGLSFLTTEQSLTATASKDGQLDFAVFGPYGTTSNASIWQ